MEKTGMQAPQVVWAKKLLALFECDPDVTVDYSNAECVTRVYVKGDDKAESISEILPCDMTFGNLSMPVEVIPANEEELTVADHLRRAFANNPALVDVIEHEPVPGGAPLTYALFAPAVTQVECDDASSPYGISTYTYEALARDVLGVGGVLISSELLDD